jgi:hypothetical protein
MFNFMNILLGSNNVGRMNLKKQIGANIIHWFISYLLQTLVSILWHVMMMVNDKLGRMAVRLVMACFKVLCSWISENSDNPEEVCLLQYNAI